MVREDPPVRIGIPTADTLTPLFGVIGILSALEQRHRTGLGQYIDVSMLGTLTSVVAVEPFDVLERLGIPMRTGPTVPRLAPFGVYPAADGHVVICAPGYKLLPSLLAVMGALISSMTPASARRPDVSATPKTWTPWWDSGPRRCPKPKLPPD